MLKVINILANEVINFFFKELAVNLIHKGNSADIIGF
ncbi:hypothetical protein OKW21_001339 [Catalinimonas alkaloidigena]|nr:hypothetical protein [Catalinimonas alkaloidigena]